MIDEPSGAVEVDRRAMRRELRRDAIYDAALALFAERGFEGTTMEDVAVQADVARATVFNHFPQKAAFLQEWAARRRRRALDAARAGSAAGEGLRDVLVRFFTVMGEPREASRSETAALILGTAHSTNIWLRSPLAEDLARILAAAQQRGELDRDVDADHAGLLLAAAYHVVLTAWAAAEPAPFELTPRLIASVDLLLDGLRPR